jgi:hypothetical protein
MCADEAARKRRVRARQFDVFVVYSGKPSFDEGAREYRLATVKSRLRVILPILASLVAGVVPGTTGGADRGAKANGLQHVTLIGDSVATALPSTTSRCRPCVRGSAAG